MKLFKRSRGSAHTNFMGMSKKLVTFSCLIGGALLSVCASAHADWQYVGLLKNYSGIPNFDACSYRAEIVYPSVKGGPIHSDSVIFTGRYKYRGVGTGKGSGNLDLLEGQATRSMSNHIFLSAIGDDDFNNKDEFIGNLNDRGETFEVRFSSDSQRRRLPNEAYITFAHPSTGKVERSQVNSSHVKLFENCTGAYSSK